MGIENSVPGIADWHHKRGRATQIVSYLCRPRLFRGVQFFVISIFIFFFGGGGGGGLQKNEYFVVIFVLVTTQLDSFCWPFLRLRFCFKVNVQTGNVFWCALKFQVIGGGGVQCMPDIYVCKQ